MAGPAATLVARFMEASPSVVRSFRTAPLPGKRLVVRHLRADRLPPAVVAACSGINFDLDLSDDVQRKMLFQCYERREVRCAVRQAPAKGGGVCIDAGAYVGIYSLNLARRMDAAGIVHAFEPEPTNFARLTENCRLNPFGAKVRRHQIALSNRDDRAPFFKNTTEQGRPYGSLAYLDGPADGAETVPTMTLDTFLGHEQLERVDLLKIDVEAHELEVLQGAGSALDASVFGAILIEFNGVRLGERGTTLEAFLAALSDHGYAPIELNITLLWLMRRGVIRPSGICTNFLFRPLTPAVAPSTTP